MVKYGRVRQATDGNITRRMRFACPIAKAAEKSLLYLILIDFSLQQWLREHASVLRCTYIVCLFYCSINIKMILNINN